MCVSLCYLMECVSPCVCVCVHMKVCLSAVGLVGDLCRALSFKISPYCDSIMEIFVTALSVSLGHLVSASLCSLPCLAIAHGGASVGKAAYLVCCWGYCHGDWCGFQEVP